MPERYRRYGDLHAAIDEHPGSIVGLLELSARHEREGLGDAPWPPQYRKAPDEPPRAPPSKRKRVSASASPRRTPSPARRRS
jgi:hypothetical protein